MPLPEPMPTIPLFRGLIASAWIELGRKLSNPSVNSVMTMPPVPKVPSSPAVVNFGNGEGVQTALCAVIGIAAGVDVSAGIGNQDGVDAGRACAHVKGRGSQKRYAIGLNLGDEGMLRETRVEGDSANGDGPADWI